MGAFEVGLDAFCIITWPQTRGAREWDVVV